MKHVNCSQETAVRKAAHSGEWPESLKAHTALCNACREVVETSRWMQTLAHPSEKTFPLRDASLLWWRAQLSEKQTEAERAQETLEWAEISSVAVIVAGLAGWITWDWQQFQGTVGSLVTSLWPQAWIASYSVAGPTPIPVWSILLILSLAAIFVVYPMLVEE